MLLKSRASRTNRLWDQPAVFDLIFHQLVAGVSPLRKKERRNEVVVDRIVHRDWFVEKMGMPNFGYIKNVFGVGMAKSGSLIKTGLSAPT